MMMMMNILGSPASCLGRSSPPRRGLASRTDLRLSSDLDLLYPSSTLLDKLNHITSVNK
jgi:hypothetical protein